MEHLNTKDRLQWHNVEYDTTHFFLSGLYALLFWIFSFLTARLYASSTFHTRWQRVFHPLILLGIIARMTYFLLQPFIVEKGITIYNIYNNFLNLVPSIIFFTNYLIILFLWAEIYHYKAGLNIVRLKPVFWITTLLMWFMFFMLYVIDFIIYERVVRLGSEPSNPVERTLEAYIGALYIITSVGFIVYGTRIYLKLQSSPMSQISSKGRKLIQKILLLASLVGICFIIRFALVIVNSIVAGIANAWWFDLIYWTLLECLPLILMITILHGTQKKKQNKQKIGGSGGSGGGGARYTTTMTNDRSGLLRNPATHSVNAPLYHH